MSRTTAVALAVAGGTGAVALLLGSRRAAVVEAKTTEAVATGGTFAAGLTGYWPHTAKESERMMEGGLLDRRGKPLINLEMHRADPAKYPYVSVSGDDAIFPYGQRIEIDAFPGVVFRVVDTGGRFRGPKKLYRAMGAEPLDICIHSSKTKLPKRGTVKIAVGDHFDKKTKQINVAEFKGQDVRLTGLELLACRV